MLAFIISYLYISVVFNKEVNIESYQQTIPTPPPYNSSVAYSGSVLIDIGFPSVSSTIKSESNITTDLFQYDILFREYMNISYPYCRYEQIILKWCCVNGTTSDCNRNQSNGDAPNSKIVPFNYCIITEKWPQDNIVGWLNNTSFTDQTQSWTGYSMLCTCKMSNRMVWVSNDPSPYPVWNPNPCDSEIVLWSFYVLETIMYVFLIFYLSYLSFVKLITLKLNKKNILPFFMVITVVWLIMACFLRIASLIYEMITRSASGIPSQVTFGWLIFWAGIPLLVASTWVIFVFSSMANTMLMKTPVRNTIFTFINNRETRELILTIFKYTFSVAIIVCLILLIIFQSLASNAATNLQSSYHLVDKTRLADKVNAYYRTVEIVAIVIQIIIITSYALFIGFIYFSVGFTADKHSYKHTFLIRVYYLTCAEISIFLFTCVIFVELTTLLYDTGASYTNNEYDSNVGKLWTNWLQGFFAFFWILFTALSISVTKEQKKELRTKVMSDTSRNILSVGAVTGNENPS